MLNPSLQFETATMDPILEKWVVSTKTALGYHPDAIITDISTFTEKYSQWIDAHRDENNHDKNIPSTQTGIITPPSSVHDTPRPQHQCSHSPETRRNIVRLNRLIVELEKTVDKTVVVELEKTVDKTVVVGEDFIRPDGTKIRYEDIMTLGWNAIGSLKGCVMAVLFGFSHNESTFPPMKDWKTDRAFAKWFRKHNLNFWKHTTWYITVGKVFEQSYSEVTDETLQDFIETKLKGKTSSSYCKQWAQQQNRNQGE